MSKFIDNVSLSFSPLLFIYLSIQAGDKLKESKKKPSTQDNKEPRKDWGKGMACVGRTKICSLVPSNHRGPVPGIEVGMCWIFRVQVNKSFKFSSSSLSINLSIE